MKHQTEVEILLVEDNPRDAELALRALKASHLANHVVWVKDGAEALELLLGTGGGCPAPRPRVVLLDLKLPKVDGLEVLRRLKGDARTQVIPVVMLTSSREESDLVRSYRLGANSFIVKPVDCDNFEAVLKQLGLYWLQFNQMPAVNPTL
jgi:CheY-like chemotaxis protein